MRSLLLVAYVELRCFKMFSGRMEPLLEDGLCCATAVMADEHLVLPAYGLGRTLQAPLQQSP